MPAIGVGKELGDALPSLVTQDLVDGSHCSLELNTSIT